MKKRRTRRMIEDRCTCGHPLTPQHLRDIHRGIKNRDETITKRNRMIRQMQRDQKKEASP